MPEEPVDRDLERLGPADLRDLVERAHRAFAAHRAEIDELNVFPVPDGDTGTNLVLTVATIRDEIADVGDDELPQALAKGALMGARGNSGVIFSQVIRGLTEAFTDHAGLDAEALADGLARARDHAYGAVANPVEGTMLTVIRHAADIAASARGEPSLTDLVARLVEAVHLAVEATTEQLDALRDAGVVDAGARGFEVFLVALRSLVAGEQVAEAEPPAPVVRRRGRSADREAGSSRFRFEVQYLLEAPEDAAPLLRERLSQLGDSVVVVAAGGYLNVHVHTNDIGPAIEAGVGHGAPSRIAVTEFADQIAARDAAVGRPNEPDEPEVGVVTVLPGRGLIEVAEGHGATVVEGRAGELPSVADLLTAVGATRGRRVVILPGHRNVVPAAHQAAEVSALEGGREIEVVDAAASPPAVLAALSIDAGPDEMERAAAACRAGEVVPAVRDAETPIGDVRAGQFLVVATGDVVGVADDPLDAVRCLIEAMEADGAELVTVVVGAGVDDDERGRVVALLHEALGEVEYDVVDGGQHPARYLVGIE